MNKCVIISQCDQIVGDVENEIHWDNDILLVILNRNQTDEIQAIYSDQLSLIFLFQATLMTRTTNEWDIQF